MRRKTKAQIAAEFDAAALKIAVDEFGGTLFTFCYGDDVNAARIGTAFGTMTAWPASFPGKGSRSTLFTVFCRFDTHDRAALGRAADCLRSNPFSGKYNLHTDSEYEEALVELRAHLQRAVKGGA